MVRQNFNVFHKEGDELEGEEVEDEEKEEDQDPVVIKSPPRKKLKIPFLEIHEDYLTYELPPDPDPDPESDPDPPKPLSTSILDGTLMGQKLMERMGWQAGDSRNSLLIPIIVKKDKLGIGAHTNHKVTVSTKTTTDHRDLRISNYKVLSNRKEIHNLMRLCYEMSGEADLYEQDKLQLHEIDALWRPIAANDQSQTSEVDDEDHLTLLLSYLNNAHNFCYYCGEQYKSAADLEKHCPGLWRQDHEASPQS